MKRIHVTIKNEEPKTDTGIWPAVFIIGGLLIAAAFIPAGLLGMAGAVALALAANGDKV